MAGWLSRVSLSELTSTREQWRPQNVLHLLTDKRPFCFQAWHLPDVFLRLLSLSCFEELIVMPSIG